MGNLGTLRAQGFFALLFCTIVSLTGCGGGTGPRMDWGANDYFGFPWPNDLRRNEAGNIDIQGFPGTQNLLLKSVLEQGVPYMHGFGTNSGVIFQFNGPLELASLPTAVTSLEDGAPVMLVNLSPESPNYLQRIPVRAHFDPLKTLYQPAHLLTVLPVPGYALDPDTLYGALLFNGILDASGQSIRPAPLLNTLAAGERPETISASDWNALVDQWQQISAYVSDHTAWNPGQLAAFTLYRTMDPTTFAFPVAQALASIPDETIIDSVTFTNKGLMCGYYNHIPLEARVNLPVWQQGVHPYTLRGGMIEVDETTGVAVQQGVESTLMSIQIGCAGGDTPKVPMIYADGTGAGYVSTDFAGGFYDADDFQQVALSVAPHQTDIRAAPVLADYAKFLANFNVDVDSTFFQGITFYNLLNPAANIGNHIQSAADQLYLRRIAALLPEILERNGVVDLPLNYDFSQFSVRDDIAVLGGHSQGASIVPLAMAMDNTFNIGFLSGAATHAYFQAVHRGSIRQVIPVVLAGIVENEVDYYHPLMQILQTMHGPADSVNYVPYMKPDFMLQVAAYDDQCIPREAAAALGLAMMRAGYMQPAEPYTRHGAFFDPDGVLGLTADDDVVFPVTEGNLDNGGVGLFLQVDGGHHWYMALNTGRSFFDRATGINPEEPVSAPKYSGFGGGCDVRYEQGYNP
ncbi:MAG: hypothetical protein D9N11_00485 [Ketobacter sp.]|nr:MAG: hypothetical protein D9N11_00485 [Ketobacter sp.]